MTLIRHLPGTSPTPTPTKEEAALLGAARAEKALRPEPC
jgi:hypothetical protein